MARAQTLTVASLINLVNLDGLYLLGYAWLFGMCKSDIYCRKGLANTSVNLVQLSGSPSSEVRHIWARVLCKMSKCSSGVIAFKALRRCFFKYSWKYHGNMTLSASPVRGAAAQDLPGLFRDLYTSIVESSWCLGSQTSWCCDVHRTPLPRWCRTSLCIGHSPLVSGTELLRYRPLD